MSTDFWLRRMALCFGLIVAVGGMIDNVQSSEAPILKELNTEPSEEAAALRGGPQHSSNPANQGNCQGNIACYYEKLEGLVKTKGTAHALQFIEEVVLTDRTALSDAHNLTHHVGRVSYHHLQDVTAVMFQCTPAHQSGCYHGALEAYLSNKSHVQPDDVVAICSPKLEADKGRFAYFNCFHGLGHGLTMHFNHNMNKALTLCDTLTTAWDQQSCYGGVFMENVVTGISGSHQHSAHQGETHASHQAKLIDRKDPLFPCSAIEKKYWRECYMMQTSIILYLTQYDYAKAFQVCDGAPESMIPICYQSMGRDISGHTLREIDKSISLCSLGSTPHQSRCFVGVVKNFLNVTGRASEDAFAFCRQVPKRHKQTCHFAIGEEFQTLFAKPRQRRSACVRSEAKYLDDCHQGAGLRRD